VKGKAEEHALARGETERSSAAGGVMHSLDDRIALLKRTFAPVARADSNELWEKKNSC